MENKNNIHCKFTYQCGICGKSYDSVLQRAKCEIACAEKAEEEARKIRRKQIEKEEEARKERLWQEEEEEEKEVYILSNGKKTNDFLEWAQDRIDARKAVESGK